VGELEEAASHAVAINSIYGVNTYFTPAMLDEDAPPFGRSSDSDIIATEFLWADLDDEGVAERARETVDRLRVAPSYTVVTGRFPYVRVQLFFRVDEPVTDLDTIRRINGALVGPFHSDPSVTNPARLMRLGGTIAYPTKEGRIVEPTEFRPQNGQAFTVERLEQVLGVAAPSEEQAKPLPKPSPSGNGTLAEIYKVPVGQRDAYMRNTVLACFREYVGEHGCVPTIDEVFDVAWPQFDRGTYAEAHDPKKMRVKIAYLLRRFTEGRLPGLPTLEAVVDDHRARQEAEERERVRTLKEKAVTRTQAALADVEGITETFPLLMFNDVNETAEAHDFVEDTLTVGGMSVLYGDSNTGKTFWALRLALHVALGWEWEGKEVDKGGVIYVALEGARGVQNRILAFRKEHPLTGQVPFAILPSQINLFDPEADLARLIATIKDAVNQMGLPVSLIVLDTLARAIAGGNENSAEDMGQLVANSGAIQQMTGAHVMFIHHTGKDQARGARGHSSLRAATDTEIEISREQGSDFGNVRVTKQRDLEGGQQYAFTLKPVVVGTNRRGKDITSCVVVPVEAKTVDTKRPKIDPNTKTGEALKALEYLLAEYGELVAPETKMAPQRVVPLSRWRSHLLDLNILSRDNAETARRQWNRVQEDLRQKEIMRSYGDLVWLTSNTGTTGTEAGQ
jgi:hypothetical protein